jgi:small-conductance mechanosensitive channel
MLVAALLLLVQQVTAPVPPDTARLVVANRAVAVFRAPLGALSPAERAAAAVVRIDSAAARRRDSVDVVASPEGLLVRAGGVAMFVVTPGDVRSAEKDSLTAAADRAAGELRLALRDVRDAQSLKAILIGLALALLATAMLVALFRGLAITRRALLVRARAFSERVAPHLEIRGTSLLRATQIAKISRHTVNWLTAGIVMLALYIYTGYVLTRFPWTRPWGEALGHYLATTLGNLGISILRAVPELFTIFVIFMVTRFATGIVRTFFDAVGQGRVAIPGIHPDTALPTRRIANGLLWMFAVVVAYPYVPGSQSTAFKGVSVFTGLLITLGSAGLVGQAMSGLVLMYSRSFRVGQFIQAGSVQGTVVELGLLATRVRTPKNELITLPNSVVIGGAVTNYTAASEYGHPLLIYSSVTIGYDVPWRRVHELLVAAAGGLDFILKDPAPFVLQRALDDSYVEYQINAPIDPERSPELPMLYARLHAAIQDEFAQADVEILSPTYLSMRDGNKSTVPKLGTHAPPSHA